MNGYLLLAIELAAILVVCVGLALFLGWVLGKRSARAKLTTEQDSSQTPATDALKTSRVEEKKEPTPLTSRAVPVTAQTSPVTTQSPSPIMASASDPQQPVSSPSPFAPSPSPTSNAAPAETGTTRPDPLNDHTISDDSAVDTHLIPRIADQTTSPAPEPKASDPRLLDAEARANEAESKAREAEARIEEANQRAREAETKAQEAEAKVEAAEAKVEEAGQQITQADQRVSEAEAKAQEADQMARAAETRAAEAETRMQEANQHINDAEQARRQVVELEERINKQEIDMARLENRATTAWDKTMPTLIERIESLEDDLSHARREAAELQAMLASERDQSTPTPAPEADTEEETSEAEPVHEDTFNEDTGQTEVIKEDSWQTIGPGTGAAQETPIAFASSTLPSMQPAKEGENEEAADLESAEKPADTEETADTKTAATEEPEPTSVTAEDAPAEAVDTDPVDEKTDETEESEEQQPTAEESAEGEEPDVRSHEQLAPTAVVEHEVEIPDHDAHDEEPADLEPAEEPADTEETADTKTAATEEPEPTSVTAEDAPAEDSPEEDAPAEAVDTDPVDEKTDETDENEEQQPTAEESAEGEEPDVHSHEQLAPTAVVEHEVEIPDHDAHDEEPEAHDEEPEAHDEEPEAQDEESADTKADATEEPEPDEEATETRLMPLIPEPTFTNFDEFTAAWKARETARSEKKPQSTSHTTTAWPEPEDVEAVTATRLIPVIKEEEPAPRPNGKDDLEALTDTGSFARLIATGPAPEAPSFTAPLDIPETEYLTPSTPAYPVTAHHDDATIPDIPRITAPIAQPFEAKQDDATPDSQHDATPSKSDLLIDETEVDEVPVTAGLAEPEPAADPRVNAGHIIAPQFSMTKEHDGILRSPLERKGQQISISLEEDYTLADPIDEEIEVMDAPEEEFPVGVGIPPEDYPRAR